ncbi:MAG: hypothetical protein JWN04_4210 [Myxococcaceae bacterium]|nr:hypothetical protein [Myxococcaceae bacterium]
MSGVAKGYMRVSTTDQSCGSQRLELLRAGVGEEHLYEEHGVSGTKAALSRPVLSALLGGLQPGDTLVVYKLDRLARSTLDLLRTVELIESKGARLRSLSDSVDTRSASGRLLLTVLGAIAAFERDTLIERTKSGLEHARAQGRKLGTPKLITAEQERKLLQLVRAGWSVVEAGKQLGLSKSSAYRIVTADAERTV